MRRSARISSGVSSVVVKPIPMTKSASAKKAVPPEKARLAKNSTTPKRLAIPKRGGTNPSPFLNLPPELRQIIYQFYYGSCDLVLKYYHVQDPSHIPGDGLTVAMSTVHGAMPEHAIHQVSRLLASEATPIWLSATARLSIQNLTKQPIDFDEFCPPDLCGDLKKRLKSIEIMTFATSQSMDWDRIIQECPELKSIDLVFQKPQRYPSDSSDNTDSWRQHAERVVHRTMENEERHQHQCMLYDTEVWELVQAVEQHRGTEYSLTAIFHGIGYREPAVSSIVASPGEQLLMGSWSNDEKCHETWIKYKILKDKVKLISKICETEQELRVQWHEGMDRPVVVHGRSGEQEHDSSYDYTGTLSWPSS